MPYYKKEDFDIFVKSKYNKYSKKYLHSVEIYKNLQDGKYEILDLYNSKFVSEDINKAIEKCEEFKKYFIVASSCEIDLNHPLTGQNYDTVWVVDLDKNIVKCLNGITGAEAYHIDTILEFKGDILAPCSGTPGRWNRLEINYPEFREQLERILKENNYENNKKRTII